MRRTSRPGAPRYGRGSKEQVGRDGACLVFADETGAGTDPPVRRTWGRKGRTPLIARSRRHRRRVNAVGWLCVDPLQGTVRLVYTAQHRPITQHDLPALIDRVHAQVGVPVVLIWDNHSSHRGARMREELAARPWLSVVHLPTYAPELNPVEALWSHLKRVLANRAFRGVDELEKVLRSHLRSVQKRPGLLRGFIRSVGLDPDSFPSIT
ncbi:IS630 family transposase [Nocardiopsis sp. FIRDI 009]|uniref:IS630 family transposase n=1 Tax=Nocardiopsis sp. FIRDI 009 TaxID=714197 RepID=UPI000E225992|nr:IS630 family transposase [Nocardiopsis sp. FIRDI 009]